jgi:hypothetical protein
MTKKTRPKKPPIEGRVLPQGGRDRVTLYNKIKKFALKKEGVPPKG